VQIDETTGELELYEDRVGTVGACESMTDRLSLHDVCLARHEIVAIAHIVNANRVIFPSTASLDDDAIIVAACIVAVLDTQTNPSHELSIDGRVHDGRSRHDLFWIEHVALCIPGVTHEWTLQFIAAHAAVTWRVGHRVENIRSVQGVGRIRFAYLTRAHAIMHMEGGVDGRATPIQSNLYVVLEVAIQRRIALDLHRSTDRVTGAHIAEHVWFDICDQCIVAQPLSSAVDAHAFVKTLVVGM